MESDCNYVVFCLMFLYQYPLQNLHGNLYKFVTCRLHNSDGNQQMCCMVAGQLCPTQRGMEIECTHYDQGRVCYVPDPD